MHLIHGKVVRGGFTVALGAVLFASVAALAFGAPPPAGPPGGCTPPGHQYGQSARGPASSQYGGGPSGGQYGPPGLGGGCPPGLAR